MDRTGRSLRVLFFGTYDVRSHPRVQVLMEGFAAHGDAVEDINVPLGLDTSWRVRILQRPWLAPVLVARVLIAWWRLWRAARRAAVPDAVVVGYLGHFDVHLARLLWRRTPIALDHLISLSDTAVDRRSSGRRVLRALGAVDAAAVARADVPVVDTEGHRELLPAGARGRAAVVAVGAPQRWFHEPSRRRGTDLMRVCFFGLYTPLQGAPVIGAAIGRLAGDGVPVRFTMVGSGQDLAETRRLAGEGPAEWRDWVDAGRLPDLVAGHDVCLGIFDTGEKAARVVPNKVFQGAAAGCAIVTADTSVQRAALGDAAVYVPAGSAEALAEALAGLAADPDRVWALRLAASARARDAFRPAVVVNPLRDRLLGHLCSDASVRAERR